MPMGDHATVYMGALADLASAEDVVDDEGNGVFNEVMPRNSLKRKLWETCRRNLESQLRTNSKGGFRCVTTSLLLNCASRVMGPFTTEARA